MLPKRKEVRVPLLKILAKHEGSARPKDLYDPLAKQFKLTEKDLAETCGGDSKWQAYVRGARDEMVESGLIYPSAAEHRGIWRLTAAGKKAAKAGRIDK